MGLVVQKYGGSSVADAEGVKRLAAIPSKEVLLAQLAGLLMSPIQRLAGVVAAISEKRAEPAAAEAPAAEAPAAAA